MSRPLSIRLAFLWIPVLMLLCGCDIGRKYEAALLLADMASPDGVSRLQKTTPSPRKESVAFEVHGRRLEADLYLSPEGTLAGLLLVPGAAEKGKDDPRLVAFAKSLARARFAVLVPDLLSLRRLQVHSGNIEEVAGAISWLMSQPGLTPGGRVGMAAFSYAAAPVVIAAMQPQLRSHVRFILTVGGYYDPRRVLVFFTTGYYCQDGQWRYRRPNAYGKWIFVLANVEYLDHPEDRRLLSAMARRKLEDLSADLEEFAGGLSPQGQDVYAFIVNRDPERARQLLAELPAAIHEEIRALNPARRDLARLEARMILVHGYDDPIIPFTESVAFDQALPEEQARLYLVDGLAHVDVRPGWISRWRLWRAVDALLAERDP